METGRVALVILDGWGLADDTTKSAPAVAATPFIDHLYDTASFCTLQASEEAVGLPEGQVGNSEVGHTTLGSGRVKYQDLVRISRAVHERGLVQHELLRNAVLYAQQENKQIHLMGLLSDGGVHSHMSHVFGLIDAVDALYDGHYFVHAFTDGRDTDPLSGVGFVQDLQKYISDHVSRAQLMSIVGRYYAMDRDTRWERVKVAYDLLVHGQGERTHDFVNSLKERYATGETDEFLLPMQYQGGDVDSLNAEYGTIQPGDVVIFWNFRSDRARELTDCLTQHDYASYGMQKVAGLNYLCMTEYDASFVGVDILFPPMRLDNVLGSVLSARGKTQLRIAETEKYPHVTFFFNGGEEQPYSGEERILIPSPKVATYDLQPEMSAHEVTQACKDYVEVHHPDFICLNYANPDMVGHTGVFDAVVRACETIDACAQELCLFLEEQGYAIIMLADHGNADYMINDDGTPNTAHSLALVPCFVRTPHASQHVGEVLHLRHGTLADVAPTILDLMGIHKPEAMSGETLIVQ